MAADTLTAPYNDLAAVRALLQKEHTLEELPALVHKVLAGLPAGQAP